MAKDRGISQDAAPALAARSIPLGCYRIPAFAAVPRTEVPFADTVDAFGPFGAGWWARRP